MEVPLEELQLQSNGKPPVKNIPKSKKTSGQGVSRWQNIRAIYVIYPGVFQAYAAKQLKTVNHYQCPQDAVPVMRESASQVSHGVSFITIPGDTNYKDEFLSVRNDLLPSHFRGIRFLELMKEVSKVKQEHNRNHRRVDIGATGNNNSNRTDPMSLGLAKPACHAPTTEPWAKELLVAITQSIKRIFPDLSRTLYQDPQRMQEFAWKYAGNDNSFVETGAVIGQLLRSNGVTLGDELLSAHTDNHNDGSDPRFETVVGLSSLQYNQEHDALIRFAQVTYGKKAAADYMVRKKLFGPILEMVDTAYKSFPLSEINVSTDIMPTKDQPSGRVLRAPHTMKTVYYSVLIHPVECLFQAHPALLRNGWFLFAAIFTMVVSNCPQVHHYSMMELCRNPTLLGSHVSAMDPFNFAWLFYNHLWDVKDGKVPRDHSVTPRYQPSHNSRISRDELENSMKGLARAAYFLTKIPIDELTEQLPYYRSRVVCHLASACPKRPVDIWDMSVRLGAKSCGELIAQHFLAVMALLGVIPLPVLSGAEIAIGTATWKCLRSFGLSDDKHGDQSAVLLSAVASRYGISLMQAEEIVCKATQHKRNTEGKKTDWIAPATPLRFVGPNNAVMKLNCDGSCTKHEPLAIDMSIPFQGAPRLTGDFWKLGPLPGLLGRKTSGHSKPPDLSRHFPLVIPRKLTVHGQKPRNGCKLPVPHPQTVLLSVPRSNELRKFNSEVIVRDLCKLDPDCADRKVWDCSAVMVNSAGTPSLVKEAAAVAGGMKLSKRERKRKFQEDASKPVLELPPGVYHCRGIIIPGCRQRQEFTFWPPPTFCLREDYCGKALSFVYGGRRYFPTKLEAKSYCCLAALMHLPLRRKSLGWQIVSVPNSNQAHDLTSDDWFVPGTKSVIRNDGFATGISIICKDNDRKSHSPYLVGVRYRGGGVAYYLTDDCGWCRSGVHLLPPPPLAERVHKGISIVTEYVGVLAHNKVGKHCKLLVQWRDGTSTWESRTEFTRKAQWPVYYYAERHGLLGTPGWKHLAREGRKKLPPLFVMASVDDHDDDA